MKKLMLIPITAAALTFAGCPGDDARRTDDTVGTPTTQPGTATTPGATTAPGTMEPGTPGTVWEDSVVQPGVGTTPGAPGATVPGTDTGTTGAGAGAPR